MARDRWDPTQLPDLGGKRYLVTGSTAGLGFFSCLQLAGAGAHVIMTGRNPNRLAAARVAELEQTQAFDAAGSPAEADVPLPFATPPSAALTF